MLFLADRSEASVAGADFVAEERDFPERSWQLLREDATGTADVQLDLRNHQAQRNAGAARSSAQGGLSGEDRSDHRIGEGVYRTAGHCGWTLRPGAEFGSRHAGCHTPVDRTGDLRSVQASVGGGFGSAGD